MKSRCFQNDFDDVEDAPTKLTKTEKLTLARELIDKCQSFYEGKTNLGSLYCGGLGPCVYLPLRYVECCSDHTAATVEMLETALRRARESIRHEEAKTSAHSFQVTLLESPWVGAKALECALLKRLVRNEEASRVAQHFLLVLQTTCASLGRSECEVLYGRAGAIQAILFVRKYMQDSSFGTDLVMLLAKEIVERGRLNHRSGGLPFLWVWFGEAYLGAAHGTVGIIQSLLSLSKHELGQLDMEFQRQLKPWIRETIDALNQRYTFPSGNLKPTMNDDGEDELVHWCHGATGYVMLLVKAAKVFGTTRYATSARHIAATVLWQRGLLRKGVGLCHGISGNAYVFLSLCRQDSLSKRYGWLEKAERFGRFAVDHLDELECNPDSPYSLFEGTAGLATLLLDMLHPQTAKFPLYEF